MQLYIVLAVTLFMMVMFIWNKIPFGVTTMTCCVILAATGCIYAQLHGQNYEKNCGAYASRTA